MQHSASFVAPLLALQELNMKNLLILALLVFGFAASAEPPTKKQLETYQAIVESRTAENMWFKLREKPCFHEHVCSSGPIGKYAKCEDILSICIGTTRDPIGDTEARFSGVNCSEFFSEFTAEQTAMFTEPKFCEMPPNPIAFQPTFAQSEIACYCDNYSTILDMNEPDFVARCHQDLSECTSNMEDLDATDRARCRGNRAMAVVSRKPWLTQNAIGSCKIAIEYPFLWDDKQSLAATSNAAYIALEAEHPELQDESDLDLLDF